MNNVLPSIAEMRRAFRMSDSSYDGVFVAAVKTTHIFCRPCCPARKPLPANMNSLPLLARRFSLDTGPASVAVRSIKPAGHRSGWSNC